MREPARYTTLVSTEVLASHLADPDWAIVDCRFDLADPALGRNQYLAGHVPGAVYAHLDEDLSGPTSPASGRHPLPDPDAFVRTLGRLGIDRRVQVVVYDQDVNLYASRLWWLLRSFGHERVAALDGGYVKWIAEGRPSTPGEETRPPRSFDGRFDASRFVDIGQVASIAHDSRAVLVDVRAPERYRGETEPIDPVAGHIPGAVNRFARLNLAPDGTMLPPDALRAAFGDLFGRVPSRDAVFYCGSGVFSCHSLLAVAHAGLEPGRLYVGSWSEWCRNPGRPIATGDMEGGASAPP